MLTMQPLSLNSQSSNDQNKVFAFHTFPALQGSHRGCYARKKPHACCGHLNPLTSTVTAMAGAPSLLISLACASAAEMVASMASSWRGAFGFVDVTALSSARGGGGDLDRPIHTETSSVICTSVPTWTEVSTRHKPKKMIYIYNRVVQVAVKHTGDVPNWKRHCPPVDSHCTPILLNQWASRIVTPQIQKQYRKCDMCAHDHCGDPRDVVHPQVIGSVIVFARENVNAGDHAVLRLENDCANRVPCRCDVLDHGLNKRVREWKKATRKADALGHREI